jgi:hypothetical protein
MAITKETKELVDALFRRDRYPMKHDKRLDMRHGEMRIRLTRADCKDLHALIFAAEQYWSAMPDWTHSGESDEKSRNEFADNVRFVGNKIREMAQLRDAEHFSFMLTFLQIGHVAVLCKLEGEQTLSDLLKDSTITKEQEREISRLQRSAARIGEYLETLIAHGMKDGAVFEAAADR